MTHEFLALMLGVRRAGVTDELHVLENMRAVKSTRGMVRVVDRAKLEEIAGGCYGLPEREYERLIGRPIRSIPPSDSVVEGGRRQQHPIALPTSRGRVEAANDEAGMTDARKKAGH
jgi:hypothetical protein